jgi:2-succinyl-6-hydroxy-2,4-cyclohexadiene-1-carboxylate synthase
VPLHVEVRGSGPPLTLLHGFTQTGRLWGAFGERLADDFTLIAIDLPGHGGSDGIRADLPSTAAMVSQAVTNTIGSEPTALLGYSLGARVALHVALDTELQLDAAVLIGATGGMEDPAARATRRAADDATAEALEASGDVDAFIDQWVKSPMFSRLGPAAADITQRRRNTARGLASSLRLAGTGTQVPLWDRLPSLVLPVMALAGMDDTRFAAHALRMVDLLPMGLATLIPGGGHAVHLAQPEVTWRVVHHWLSAVLKAESRP